jgi:hypothetical protein
MENHCCVQLLITLVVGLWLCSGGLYWIERNPKKQPEKIMVVCMFAGPICYWERGWKAALNALCWLALRLIWGRVAVQTRDVFRVRKD